MEENKNVTTKEVANESKETVNNSSEKKPSKLSKCIVPLCIALILVAFAGVIYYTKAIKPDRDIDKKAGFTAEDYITLGKYTGFKTSITQTDFDNSVHEETDAYNTVDRKSRKGDHVEFKATAYIKGKKVDDISQESIELEIGGKLDGVHKEFEKAITGVKNEDKVKVTVNGSGVKPISKSHKTYTGKVDYKLEIVNVSELEREKITDKWVKENYEEDYGITTVAEFYDWIDEYLTNEVTGTFWQKTVDSAKMNGWPSKLYDSVVKEFTYDANYQADAMDMKYEEYLAFQGLDNTEDLEEEYKNEVKSALVMWAIVKKEGLKASEDEIEEKYEELIDGEDLKTVEDVKKEYKRSEIEESVLLDKAQQFVTKHSTIKKEFKKPVK